jgi:Tol biopolymer transport system component
MLYRVDVKTGAYREIPNTETPGTALTYPWLTWALSPDGKTVYFNRQKRGADPDGVYAADIAGGPARFVFTGPGGKFGLSPDGRTLLWNKTNGIVRVAVDGTGPREFRVNGFISAGPVWTPDGRAILFGAWESGKTRKTRIMRIPAEGGEPEFTGVELPAGARDLTLSPDGTRLAFSLRIAADELWALDNVASVLREAK